MAQKSRSLKCPICKNKNFAPSKEVPKPVVCYGTDPFATVRYRYYMCMQCNYKWETKEGFNRKVKAKEAQKIV